MSYRATERSVWALLSIVLSVSAVGCESPKSKPNLDGADGSVSGGGGDGGYDGKVVLPGGFEPAIDCDGLGQACGVEIKCPGKLACAGSNCMPAVDNKKVFSCGDASCPAEAPVCTLGICLSVDQLGCVCANPDAQEVYSQCKSLLPQGAPTCTPEDGLCDGAPSDCCEGLSCLRGKDASGRMALGLCKVPCGKEADCATTECCASADGIAGSFCGPRDLCRAECRGLREECDGDLTPCCEGFICATSPSDPVLDGCQKVCEKDVECDSGCCILFTGKDNGVCGPKDRCLTPAM